MEKLTKEQLSNYNHHLTVGRLKEFIEKYNISDDAIIVVERVEDSYFEGSDISGMRGCNDTEDGIYPEGSKAQGWGVYLKKGQGWHMCDRHNKKVRSGEYNNKEQYPDLADKDIKEIPEEEMEEMMTQYHPAWSCVKYPDEGDDILFINLHY